MLPDIAASMSASVGFGFALSNATADMIWPDWQKPHWGTSTSIHAFCTGCAFVADNPSIVVTFLPATAETGVTHARTGLPSTCTVHAPHWEMPHPYLVPVRLRFSRTTQRRGTSGSTSTCWALPLTVTEIISRLPFVKRLWHSSATAAAPAARSLGGMGGARSPPCHTTGQRERGKLMPVRA